MSCSIIINRTIYNIVQYCVLFFNFCNINVVYIYFYPDYYGKFDFGFSFFSFSIVF